MPWKLACWTAGKLFLGLHWIDIEIEIEIEIRDRDRYRDRYGDRKPIACLGN